MRNVFLLAYAAASVLSAFSATFEIGEKDFLLDGKPFVVRCGEVHYAHIPPRVMQNGFIPELFQAANFGAEPEQRFEFVRKYQLQAVTTYDAKNLVTISEFAFLDRDGNPMNALDVQITGVDSEEEIREDGVIKDRKFFAR